MSTVNLNCLIMGAGNYRSEFGRMAEDLALRFLQKHDMTLLERNFRSRFGEIDLIMQENNTIIFVEVRSRKNKAFLHPAETIDSSKRNKIRRTSQVFMQRTSAGNRYDWRFDVITLVGRRENEMEIEWIKSAF